MVDPSDAEEARSRCGGSAEIFETPVDTAWIRDNGPIFVRDEEGRVAGVHFDFNGWGGKYLYSYDDEVGDTIAYLSDRALYVLTLSSRGARWITTVTVLF